MSIVDAFRRDEIRVLDRLVDGELGQAERRELLSAFDDEPGAWRRCALAFLEAQAWRQEFGRLAAEPIVVQTRDRARAGTLILGFPRGAIGAWLAVAASLALAFGLGTRFRSDDRAKDVAEAAIAKADAVPITGDVEPADLSAELADELAGGGAGMEYVTLRPADGDDGSSEFQLAVVNDADGERLAAEQSAAASRLVDELSSAGLEVTRQQRLWPVNLSDGRQLIVPVDEFDIRDPLVGQF